MKTALSFVTFVLCTLLLTLPSLAAPTLTSPATENVSAGMATLVLQSSEGGTGYFTLLPGSGTPCGTGTQVKAGLNSSGILARYRGEMLLYANTPARYTIRNLMQNTAYTACFTADSPTGQNLQDVPVTSELETPAAISLTGKEWRAVGVPGFSVNIAFDVSLDFAPDGTPYVLFGGNGTKATVMRFLSGNWAVVGSAGFSSSQIQSPSLAFAPDGTPYVAYQDLGPNNNWKATVMKFDGTAWVPVGTAGFTAGNALDTSLAFAPDGTPYLAYMDYASNYKATVMKFSGGTWSLVGSAGFSAGQVSDTGLAFAADGTPFVVYRDGGNGNKITVQKFNGTNWVGVGSAAFSAGTAEYAKLVFSPDNVPFVAFTDGGYGGKVTVMRFSGSNWEPVGSAGFSAGAAYELSLAFSPDGTPTVALQDGSKGAKATVMKFNGASWAILGSSGFSSGSAHPVSLSYSPGGRPYVAYVDSVNNGKTTVMALQDAVTATTTTNLITDRQVTVVGDLVTLSATLSQPLASGAVSFMDGTVLLGMSQLLAGVASFSTSALSVGIHSITAVYSGDSTFTGSTSSPQQVEIKPPGFVVSSAITSPAAAYTTNAPVFTVTGSAVSISADPVKLVEVSVNGGASWQTATGTTSWSFNVSIPVDGIFTIKSRATTESGIVESPSTGVSVTFDRVAPTGTIVSAVQDSANLLTITLNTNANMPGDTCVAVYPIACGYQEISLSYDGVTWSSWQPAATTRQYSLAMVGLKTSVYAKLRDSAGNISGIMNRALTVISSCGSAHNSNVTSIPVTDLCNVGTASVVTGTGPWSWSCSAASIGSTPASCSAQQAGGIVYRSTDSGVTWTAGKSGTGFNSGADALLVSPTYSSDHTLFLGADGIYKSVDSGDSWKKVLSGYMVMALAASPAYATDHTLFAGAYLSGIYKSSDGGDTWTASNVGLSPTMVFSLAISPGFSSDHTIFAGLYKTGVFKSSDGGATWSASNAGISTSSVLSLAISPAFGTDQTLFTAVTDGVYGSGGPYYKIYKSVDGGLTWNRSDSGISGSISELGISPGYASDRTIFAYTSSGVYKSTDGGVIWSLLEATFSAKSLALSPAYAADQTLFAGVYGVNVFKSNNGGSSWSPSNSSFAVANHLASLAVSPSFNSDHTVFALTYLIGPNLSTSGDLSFGTIKSGSTSQTRQITIWNDANIGDTALNINSLGLVGPDAGQFRIAPGTCGSLKPTIPVGGQCDIEVNFAPSSTGSKSCKLQISSNAVMAIQTGITLTGSGLTVASTITSPVAEYETIASQVTIEGTAASIGGDSIERVEISMDGGATWQMAHGTTVWNFALDVPRPGTYTIVSRATTLGGIVETPGAGITITRNALIGVCGGDHGRVLAARIPSSLCHEGAPSDVSGTGRPWSWSCQGESGTNPAECSATIQSFSLTVNIKEGSGAGDVRADLVSDDPQPISLFCPTSFCSAQYDFGKTVRLTAEPDPISLFTVWEGGCTSDPCEVEMRADTAIAVSFSRGASYKNITSGVSGDTFDTLLLSANSGDEIRMLATEMDINSLVLNKAVTLTGGWKAGHAERAEGITTLKGVLVIQDSETQLQNTNVKGLLTVESGSLRADGISIQQ